MVHVFSYSYFFQQWGFVSTWLQLRTKLGHLSTWEQLFGHKMLQNVVFLPIKFTKFIFFPNNSKLLYFHPKQLIQAWTYVTIKESGLQCGQGIYSLYMYFLLHCSLYVHAKHFKHSPWVLRPLPQSGGLSPPTPPAVFRAFCTAHSRACPPRPGGYAKRFQKLIHFSQTYFVGTGEKRQMTFSTVHVVCVYIILKRW